MGAETTVRDWTKVWDVAGVRVPVGDPFAGVRTMVEVRLGFR